MKLHFVSKKKQKKLMQLAKEALLVSRGAISKTYVRIMKNIFSYKNTSKTCIKIKGTNLKYACVLSTDLIKCVFNKKNTDIYF